MTNALRRFLPEFEAPVRARAAAPAWRLLDRPPPPAEHEVAAQTPLGALEPEPARDPVGEAVSAALAEAEIRHAAALADAETRAAAVLAEARARWVAEEGQALAQSVGRAAATVGDGIADAVAALLEPFLDRAIRHAAVEELRGAVTDLVAGGAGGRIAVSGPRDLLDALAAALDRDARDRLDLAPSETAEVVIAADSSIVRTRLADWTEALRSRLEGDA